MKSKEMIKLEVGKTYITRNKRYVKIVYKSRINEEPYLGVVETDGYEMESTIWYKYNGLCLWDDFDIVEKFKKIANFNITKQGVIYDKIKQ